MHRFIRWFLYTVIVLVALIWIGLGLLRPEYLKGPFVAWVQQQTGLAFDIGKLDYNPLYPNVVLAENVTLGPDIRIQKLYLEVGSDSSWWKRDLHITHLDVVGPAIKWTPALTLPQPFNRLTVDDMTVSAGTVEYPDGKFSGLNLHVKSWRPIHGGEFDRNADFILKMNVSQADWHQYHFSNAHLDLQKTAAKLQVNNFNSTLFHGTINSQFEWDLARNQITFQNLVLEKLRIELNTMQGWPIPQPAIQADKIQLTNVSAIDLSKRFAINQINGNLRDFSWEPNQTPVFSYEGKLGEYTDGMLEASEMTGDGKLDTQSWKMELKGSAYSGTFSVDMEGDRPWHTLIINDLQASKMQPELYPGWRDRLHNLPFEQIDFHHVNLDKMSMISFDDSIPLTVKWMDLFVTDLRWNQGSWQTSSDKSRMEASWLELVYQTLVSRKADIQGELSTAGFTLDHASAQLEDAPFNASGFWSLQPDQPHQLKISLNNFDIEQLSDMLRPAYTFAGKTNLMVDVQSKGTTTSDLLKNLTGSMAVNGQDWFISGLNLDPYLDNLLGLTKMPPTQKLPQMIGRLRGGDTGFNHVNLKLSAKQGKISVDGTAFESITHLVAVKDDIDLLKQNWQLTFGLLDDSYHPELTATMKGPWAEPELQLQMPGKNSATWNTSPIHYPPQGLKGNLRQ